MKKMLYVTMSGVNGADSWNIIETFDLAKARNAAENELSHLTDRERMNHTVWIEGYEVDASEGDNPAKLFDDLASETVSLDSDWSEICYPC